MKNEKKFTYNKLNTQIQEQDKHLKEYKIKNVLLTETVNKLEKKINKLQKDLDSTANNLDSQEA